MIGQQLTVAAAATDVSDRLPGHWQAGPLTLHIRPDRSLEPAFWGPGAARFHASWASVTATGRAWVEVVPHSGLTSGLRVTLRKPRERWARAVWSDARLAEAATVLTVAIRETLESAPARERPASAAR